MLNNVNLTFLWKLSARLSLHEAFTQPADPHEISNMLDPEKIRLFGQAILESQASQGKTRILTDRDLRKVLNNCHETANNEPALRRLMQASGTDHLYTEIPRFASTLANMQFPPQDARPQLALGRALAMLDVLPLKHPDLIPSERLQLVKSILPRMNQVLTVPLRSIGECFLMVLTYHLFPYAASNGDLKSFMVPYSRISDNNIFRNTVISGLLAFEPGEQLDQWLPFTTEHLKRIFLEKASELADPMRTFLRLFSATTEELRGMLERPEYQIGHVSSRFSPLERYPIVRLEPAVDGGMLIVPNYRHLAKSFGSVVHFTLQHALGEDYNHARGALQELYLQRLVDERLPGLIAIPELAYGRPEKRGPDLTLIDQRNGRIILVESKGRRMNLSTRLTMEPEIFNANLRDAYGALLKLPGKLEDLYSGLPAHQQFRAAIDSTRGSEPIFVVVLSEGVYFMNHLIRRQALDDTSSPLHAFAFTYCVMSLDEFERTVEISSQNGVELYSLLEEYWRQSGARDSSQPADSFAGITIDYKRSFAAQFAPAWPEIHRATRGARSVAED